jgi:hypothetical protein
MDCQAVDPDFGVIELLPLSFPLPLSTPPRPSSFSLLPLLQFTQVGRPKRNYRLPARYEDVNPEPLRSLEEEDEQPTVALPRLHLIVHTVQNDSLLYPPVSPSPDFDQI